MRKRIPPTPQALALAAERDDRHSTVAMARTHAIVLAGLTMLVLAIGAAVGGSFGRDALASTSTIASTIGN